MTEVSYEYLGFLEMNSDIFQYVFVLGLPPFDWWFYPPDEVLLKVYIFNVTNSEEFLTGVDSKLKLNEVGPIIYR